MADPLLPTMQPAFMGEWTFNNSTTAPPAASQLRLNNGGQNNATLIWVNKISFNGIDATSWLMEMIPGCSIRIQDKNDATRWHSYAITGEPVAAAGHVELKVSWLAGGGNVASGQNIMLSFIAVTVRVTGTAATASVGNVAVKLVTPVNVTAPPPMQGSVGSVTVLAKQSVVVPVTAPPPMRGFVGSPEAAGQIRLPGQAFPSDTPAGFSPGMTLRQWYASQAMSGFIMSAPAANLIGGNLAAFCFKVADSMIKHEAREAKGARMLTVSTLSPPSASPPPQSAPSSVSMKDALALQKSQAAPVNGKGKRQGRLTGL